MGVNKSFREEGKMKLSCCNSKEKGDIEGADDAKGSVYGDSVCNKAHLEPNLQFPFRKYLQTDDSGSKLCEKIQLEPAVQVPCL